ncbi:kinetochore-associated Ndc80 complex subunit spc24 [Geranomyces michiganensis]|nr:kinetochore-associated Ndc80 complex subunit spc24 [Geranomyces michiganensis]
MLATPNPPHEMSAVFFEPRDLVSTLLERVSGPQDAATIHEVAELVRRTDGARKEIVDDAHATLKALSRQLQSAKEAADDPKYRLDAKQHAAKMKALEHDRHTVVQQNADVEKTIGTLQAELEQLEHELQQLEREEEEEANLPPTKEELTLSIFKGLGLEMQKDAQGKFAKCKILRPSNQDIEIHEFDDKFSRFFYANVLWEACL